MEAKHQMIAKLSTQKRTSPFTYLNNEVAKATAPRNVSYQNNVPNEKERKIIEKRLQTAPYIEHKAQNQPPVLKSRFKETRHSVPEKTNMTLEVDSESSRQGTEETPVRELQEAMNVLEYNLSSGDEQNGQNEHRN